MRTFRLKMVKLKCMDNMEYLKFDNKQSAQKAIDEFNLVGLSPIWITSHYSKAVYSIENLPDGWYVVSSRTQKPITKDDYNERIENNYAKEIWQTTADELIKREIYLSDIFGDRTYPKWITDNTEIEITDKKTGKTYQHYTIVKSNPQGIKKYGKEAHYNIIKKAISEGKTIPAKVLKDYPDLQTTTMDTLTAPAPEVTSTTAINPVLPAEKVEVQNATMQNNTYIPESDSCASVDTVVPASMKYEMRKAIETIDRRVNGVDEYVAQKLGYCITGCTPDQYRKGMSELCKAFGAEQVDAIAVAIYNIETKGQGCIIGDQTGIGKGRIAAGIIRYAVKQGKLPIFLTQNPNLFSDIFRDIVDIHFDPAVPLERNVGTKEVERKMVKDTAEDRAAMEGVDRDEDEATEVVLVPDYQKNKYYEEDVKKAIQQTGIKKLIPFIVNGKSKYTHIKDKDGNILYKGDSQAETLKWVASGKIPSECKFVLATYSQFRQKKESDKMRFLRKVAQNNIVIMDESHNASGDSNTGKYLRDVLLGTNGVTFLSATFAKTPANMPIYANKTAMSEANLSSEDLVEAITKGGVALQEIISSQLVAEGQMIRRERSFEGIKVNYIYMDASQDEVGRPQYNKEQEHRAIMDRATEIIRDIILFQENYVDPIIDGLNDIAAGEQGQVEVRKGTKEGGVSNAPVFSGIFQMINQLLFSIKADAVADMAIARIKEGLKPVIAFASTMESFLDSITDDQGNTVQINDKINTDFSLILKKRLEGILRYTVTNSNGDKEYEKVNVLSQNAEFKTEYNRILEKIKGTSIGIVSSPIDYIIQKIKNAGFSVGEVTGRNKYIELGEKNTGTIRTRQKESAFDLFVKFNDNETDVLMINIAGAVGASAHAVPRNKVPKEQVKQRVMIVLQAELDINMEVQKRGRINRTGQIYKPVYDYAISAIPAEGRLMMMLQRKLKSLDANTSSNQKESNRVLDVPDFLNKYGDQVVVDYLKENRDVNKIIGDPLKFESSKSSGTGEKDKDIDTTNAAQKVTGRVAILPTKLQEDFYREIGERYVSTVDYLKQTGEYDLEVEHYKLEAETLERTVVVLGLGGTSPFGRNSILEKCEVNALKKPYTQEEVQLIITESLTVKDAKGNSSAYSNEEMKEKIVNRYNTDTKNKIETEEQEDNEKYDKLLKDIAKEKAYQKLSGESERILYKKNREKQIGEARVLSIQKMKEAYYNRSQAISGNFKSFLIGEAYGYPSNTYEYDQAWHKAIFLGFEINDKAKNPYAPSAIKLRFAFPNSIRYLAIPMSKFDTIAMIKNITNENIWGEEGSYMIENWNELRKKSASNRQTRYIVTGNILQAFGKEELKGGKLISYTIKGGGTKKGILLPEEFNLESGRNKKALRVTVPASKCLPFFQNLSGGSSYETSNGIVSIQKRDDSYAMFIPAATKRNKDFIENAALLALTENNRFEQSGYSRDKFVATISNKNLKKVLEILQGEPHGLSFEIPQSMVVSMEDSIDLGETEYSDETKEDQPKDIIIEKLTEEDRQFEDQQKQAEFEREQKLIEDEKKLAEDREKQEKNFDQEKRMLSVRKKVINLKSLLLGHRLDLMEVGNGGEIKKATPSPELVKFLPKHQLSIIRRSNEFNDIVTNLNSIVASIPKTYETDNIKAADKIVHLHYFYGDMDWYVVEKDSEEQQLQAYGYVIMGGPGEWGYINIEELVSSGKIELDFHFEPKKFSEINAEMKRGGGVAEKHKLLKQAYNKLSESDKKQISETGKLSENAEKIGKEIGIAPQTFADHIYYEYSFGKMNKGGEVENTYIITFEDAFSFSTEKKEAKLTDRQYETALQQMKNKQIVVRQFDKIQGINYVLRIKNIEKKSNGSSEMNKGGEAKVTNNPDVVFTKDGIKVNRKSDKNKGHIFYDEDGNGFKCLGYNPKLDDCVYLNLQNNKEVVGCVKGFYYNNPKK